MKKINIFSLKNILLILIILVALFLRAYQLENIPPGVHADEADTGYSAYSILLTGKTQYGDFNPLMFTENNGGTHPPIYTYLLIPLVYIGGLNIVIERMPSVVAGVGLVIVFYFLLKKLFKDDKVAVLGSFLLAINPWAIETSRQGLLESVALFLAIAGIALFFYASSFRLYFFSAVFLGLSLHAYDAPKIVIPLLLVALILYKWKTLIKKKYILFLVLAVFAIFFLLMLYVLKSGQINDYHSVGIFNKEQISRSVNRERFLTNAPLWLSNTYHNKLTVLSSNLLMNYSKFFNINWLYINGPESFETTTHGEYYLFELPFLFLGLYLVFRNNKKLAYLLLFWILISPIPSIITNTGHYPLRGIMLLPVPIILSSYAIIWFWSYLSKFRLNGNIVRVLLIIIVFLSALRFIFIYFLDYPVFATEYWGKQQNDAIKLAINESSNYKNIFIDGGGDWLMMYGFFTKENPAEFQTRYINKINYKGVSVVKIKNIYFGSFLNLDKIATPSSFFPKNSLLITNENNFKEVKALKNFYDPGKVRVVFKAIEIK